MSKKLNSEEHSHKEVPVEESKVQSSGKTRVRAKKIAKPKTAANEGIEDFIADQNPAVLPEEAKAIPEEEKLSQETIDYWKKKALMWRREFESLQ